MIIPTSIKLIFYIIIKINLSKAMDKKFFKSLPASDFLKSKKFFTNYFFYSFSRNSFRKIIITVEKDLFLYNIKNLWDPKVFENCILFCCCLWKKIRDNIRKFLCWCVNADHKANSIKNETGKLLFRYQQYDLSRIFKEKFLLGLFGLLKMIYMYLSI